jgi:uncharacterized membrane protein YiaA
MVIDMAKRTRNKRTPKSKYRGQYLILIGVILFLIGLLVTSFAKQQMIAGFVVLLLGVFICAVGLSKHSLHLLKRKSGKI